MSSWTKIPYSGKGKKPPYWLEMREGKSSTSYRFRYRANGCNIQKTIKGNFSKWEDAFKVAEKLIAAARFGERVKPKNFITCAELCDEIVELKKSKARGTYLQAEMFYRVHIKPFLELECPFASDLNASVWMKYRHRYRTKNPGKPLFGHCKFFSQLVRMASLKGLITIFKVDYNEAKDDNKQLGQIIPDKHIQAFIENANSVWRDRVIVQRLTGQRPGVIRQLKKEYVDLDTGIVTIPKEASKNRKTYQFKLPLIALNVLRKRASSESIYFFPNSHDKKKPMDPNINGWHEAWRRAKINKNYTPHDIRHTFLTEKVNEVGTNLPVLCYSCDLSYNMLRKTYLHLKGEDTDQIAIVSNSNAKRIFGDSL